jgi:hypothetical protein
MKRSTRRSELPEGSSCSCRLKHGLTTPEIAEALGRAPGTVRCSSRGLEVVRRSMPASLVAADFATSPPRGLVAIRTAVTRGVRAPLVRASAVEESS